MQSDVNLKFPKIEQWQTHTKDAPKLLGLTWPKYKKNVSMFSSKCSSITLQMNVFCVVFEVFTSHHFHPVDVSTLGRFCSVFLFYKDCQSLIPLDPSRNSLIVQILDNQETSIYFFEAHWTTFYIINDVLARKKRFPGALFALRYVHLDKKLRVRVGRLFYRTYFTHTLW